MSEDIKIWTVGLVIGYVCGRLSAAWGRATAHRDDETNKWRDLAAAGRPDEAPHD